MPRFDGTGPTGKGPLTGRGLGKCVGKRPQRGMGKRYQDAPGQQRFHSARG